MNPLLLPIAGGLAILLLLGLLLHLRRRADRVDPQAPGDLAPGSEADDEPGEELGHEQDADDTDIVPMLSYDEPAWDDREESSDEVARDADETTGGTGETVHTLEPLPDVESVNVRSLRAQVRTLQEALEQQDVTGMPAGHSTEATFRRQVTAALRGLGERTREDESPERTLARVIAAIDRLDAPDEVSRPVLPTVKFDLSGAHMTLAGKQYAVSPVAIGQATAAAAPPAAAAPAPAAAATATPAPPSPPAPVAALGRAATVTTPLASALAAGAPEDHREHRSAPAPGRLSDLDPFAQDEQVLPAPPEPDVVLPVPPPASHRDERHRRFGRRRGA